MSGSRGFVWLPVLFVILAALAVSGGAWWYVQQTSTANIEGQSSQYATTTQETAQTQPGADYLAKCFADPAQKHDYCYANAPLFDSSVVDVNLCKNITDLSDSYHPFLVQACINNIAFNKSDPSVCTGDQGALQVCYQRIANKTVDLKICNSSPFQYSDSANTLAAKDVCYGGIAGANHKISICELIKGDKSGCYYRARTEEQKSDISICDKMSLYTATGRDGAPLLNYYKEICYVEVAYARKDATICNKIDATYELDEGDAPSYNVRQSCLQHLGASGQLIPTSSSVELPVPTPSSIVPPSGYSYPNQCVPIPMPTTAGCQGGWKVVVDYMGCAVSYTCPANQ